MRKVVILQHRLLHYRVALFEQLRKIAEKSGVEICLVHGQPSRREHKKHDTGCLAWANSVNNVFLDVGGRDVVWQSFPKEHLDADLVVVMQENRILSNYPLLLWRYIGGPKVAYWGHGANFQSISPNGLRERWKRWLLNRVDWWFAYTDLSVDILLRAGYPSERITSLENAIDTSGFKRQLDDICDDEIAVLRSSLGIDSNSPVGLFCGSLYPDKRIDFLIESIDAAYACRPDFHCIVIGDGPTKSFVDCAATTRPWLHVVGVRKGREKALYFRLAQLMLNPGAVGLHVVDAFCAGLVLLTTRNAKHGPEIAYLKSGVNGVVTSDSVLEYTENILRLISDPELLSGFQAQALSSSEHYTLENTVRRFLAGIERCLLVNKM